MRYQTIKHLKTKRKVVAISDTFSQAVKAIPETAIFMELSYIGGFPLFASGKYVYSIQGLADIGVVCSLPEDDLIQYRNHA